MTVFIGIDPGAEGAIALLAGNGRVMSIIDMPPHAETMREILAFVQDDKFVTIETQQAMPGQGVTSMFSLGQRYGVLTGLLVALQIPHEHVRPRAWMKALQIPTGADKRAHVDKALALFPTAEVMGPRGGMKDGRADALLIAEYGRRVRGAA